MIRVDGWDLEALARRWSSALPFAHVVIDAVLGEPALGELRAAFAREPHFETAAEIYQFMSSGEPPRQPALRAFLDSLASEPVAAALRAVTGKRFARVEGRAYVYGEGHYLLPHSDCREQLGRQVAFAYYVAGMDLEGGELELFDCRLEDGEIVESGPAGRIEPRPDRLVLFDVSPATLHQVREVRRGARASIAGWLVR